MPLPVGLQKVVSSEELASSSRKSQSRVLLHKLATGGAESRTDCRHLPSRWGRCSNMTLTRDVAMFGLMKTLQIISASCIHAYFETAYTISAWWAGVGSNHYLRIFSPLYTPSIRPTQMLAFTQVVLESSVNSSPKNIFMQCKAWRNSLSFPSGAFGEIRTHTLLLLRQFPLPSWGTKTNGWGSWS